VISATGLKIVQIDENIQEATHSRAARVTTDMDTIQGYIPHIQR